MKERKAHWTHCCPEWDGLEIDEFSPEWDACICYGSKPQAHSKQAELDAADEVTEDMRVAGRDILRAWISSDKMRSLESVVQRIYTEMQAAKKARQA